MKIAIEIEAKEIAELTAATESPANSSDGIKEIVISALYTGRSNGSRGRNGMSLTDSATTKKPKGTRR
ncbi:MAG: hypothetical protein NC084_13605 [Bacteroides sp.]|nr:hypothetical protein [Bacteroides sp.]